MLFSSCLLFVLCASSVASKNMKKASRKSVEQIFVVSGLVGSLVLRRGGRRNFNGV